MSTQPRFLYTKCQFCSKELPRCQLDEHTAVCHLYQSLYLYPRVANETDKYTSSSIVTGRSQTDNMGRYHPTARSRPVFVRVLNDEDHESTFELQLLSSVQDKNTNASSCLVIGNSFHFNILFRLQRLLEKLNSILDKIENMIDKIESIIKVGSHT